MECKLCGKEVTMFTGKKIIDGNICNECLKKLPNLIAKEVKYLDLETIEMYQKDTYKDIFSETSSYGTLKLDEIHYLFKINNDIFNCDDVVEIALVPDTPVTKGKTVFVPIKLIFELKGFTRKIDVIIRPQARCEYNAKEKSWKLPSDYIIFSDMFNNMIKGKVAIMNERLMHIYESEVSLAEERYMLEEGYTLDDVKNTRNALLKTFHPDNTNEDSYKSQIINYDYKLLKSHLAKDGEHI